MTFDPFSIGPGSVLAGKYRVERVLGQGGMGFVVAAMHLELQQLVAVKFLHGNMTANTEAVARFLREARAAARIRSEHVARVIDVGRLEDGAPYTVMECLHGKDLAELLERGPLPVKSVVGYVLQACHAIAEAHAVGIVHRDLKPSNLFLTERADGTGIVKVLDFGISKLADAEAFEPQLTSTRSVMGSPLYMSPEQMQSFKDADQRTDIWSLGVILYELSCGSPPFNGSSLPELVTALLMTTPAPLVGRRAEVSPELQAVIFRCLEKEPARRFQSVGELATALLPFAPQESQSIVERVARLSGSSAPPAYSVPAVSGRSAVAANSEPPARRAAVTDASWASTGRSGPKSTRKPLAIAAALVVLLSAVGGALIVRSRPSSEQAAPNPAESFVLDRTTAATSPPPAPSVDSALPPLSSAAPVPDPSGGEARAASARPQGSSVSGKPARAPATAARAPLPAASARVPAAGSASVPELERHKTLDIDLK